MGWTTTLKSYCPEMWEWLSSEEDPQNGNDTRKRESLATVGTPMEFRNHKEHWKITLRVPTMSILQCVMSSIPQMRVLV